MIAMRQLGRGGPMVSRMGLGLAALGRPGYINLGHGDDLVDGRDVEAMEARTHRVLDAAYQAGVRYFDAARSYGRAEAFLGSWLLERGFGHENVTVGSKWGYTYTADWKVDADVHEVKNHSVETFLKQATETQTNFGLNISLYQIHSATLESGALDDAQLHEALAQLRDRTGVRIGLSVSGPGQARTIERALEIEVAGVRLFDAVQATWNPLEVAAGASLTRAHDEGLGVIVKEALANGRLTPRNDDPAFAPTRARLQAEADRLGATLDALVLAHVLTQPWADVVLSGAATTEQLLSNLNAQAISIDEQANTTFEEIAEPSEHYWKTRSQLAWN